MASTQHTPPDVASIMGAVDTYLRWRHNQQKGDRQYYNYHPSEWGKAQPLDAEIQTPLGPKKMGDLRIGDEVCTPDGDLAKVAEIHPQGTKDIYKITFVDGDAVEACEDHLWEVDSSCLGYAEPKLLTTREVEERYLDSRGRRVFSVRLPKPIKIHASAPRIIYPYSMGMLLGEGCLTIDDEIFGRIEESLHSEYEVRSWKKNVQHRAYHSVAEDRLCSVSKKNMYKAALVEFGLRGLKSNERFIPDAYLYVCLRDRWELVRGLMDSNGEIDKKGYARFSTDSKRMAMQFKWLIHSLGGLCYIREKKTTHLHSYRCEISIADSSELFHLTRKKSRGQIRKYLPKRIIASIEKLPQKEAQCITLNNEEGLYLTDHCVVTHNCLRKQQYKHYAQLGYIKVEEEDLASQTLRLFDKGHNMHRRWQEDYFADMGVLRGRWKCKNPACYLWNNEGKLEPTEKSQDQLKNNKTRLYGMDEKIGCFRPERCVCGNKEFEYIEVSVKHDDLNFSGHADLILDFSNLTEDQFEGVRSSFNIKSLPKTPIVADMKTINDWQYKGKIMKFGPHKEYIIQVTIYAHILDLEYGMIIYENKNDSSLAAYKVERSDNIFDTVDWQSHMMQKMSDRKLLPPPKPEEKSNMECKFCEFRSVCHNSKAWDDPNLDELRKKFYKNLL